MSRGAEAKLQKTLKLIEERQEELNLLDASQPLSEASTRSALVHNRMYYTPYFLVDVRHLELNSPAQSQRSTYLLFVFAVCVRIFCCKTSRSGEVEKMEK